MYNEVKLETGRLIIIPMTYEFVSKIINQDLSAYKELNVFPNDEWPNIDTKEVLPLFKKKLSKEKPDGYGVWLFIDKETKTIIGDGGYKDIPNTDGEIDIGYGIIESRWRKGYAFEAVTKLIDWGFSNKNVKKITANCLLNNIASTCLLNKLGMKEIKKDDKYKYFELEKVSRETYKKIT